MSMRRAYIGLSTPLAFDWAEDHAGRLPNPILESPVGTALLYDECWFLHPAVCPRNMREEPYVEFVSDHHDLTDLVDQFEQVDAEGALITPESSPSRFPFDRWETLTTSIAPFARHDSHGDSGVIDIPFSIQPSARNVAFDSFVGHRIDAAYVLNTPAMSFLEAGVAELDASQTAGPILDRAIAPAIANYLTPTGPPLDLIDDFRDHTHIERFRRDLPAVIEDPGEIRSEGDRLATAARELQREAISRAADPSRTWVTLTKAGVHQLPLIGRISSAVFDAAAVLQSYDATQRLGWASLYADLEYELGEH